ncbi:helix-turn-helix domain-containing protein [Labrys sp. KNU-23]|nr:helix-turn-helix domain-containing protein [Labrys sp. KNU-23]
MGRRWSAPVERICQYLGCRPDDILQFEPE